MSEQHKKDSSAGRLTELVAEKCVDCGLCRRDCLYLQKHGLPGEQARAVLENRFDLQQSFLCSLCGLCTETCPRTIDPAAMFMSLRVKAVKQGRGTFLQHQRLTNYERWGKSALFSRYSLPAGCSTVFFPGCALPGTRTNRVIDLYGALRRTVPNLGLVLDCCTKPSHDLGRIDYFQEQFGHLHRKLVEHGIREVLVACPNCLRMFSEYGRGLKVRMVYEVLADFFNWPIKLTGTVTVHDPCGVRWDERVHQAVRRLITGSGLHIEEMKHHGISTFCCGEGGGVGYINRELSANWGRMRSHEAAGRRIITYCAGCTEYLAPLTPVSHLADLLFEPAETLQGREKTAASPWTYVNRLLLKLRLQRIVTQEK
jgi:Fe-S oxidoreductase